MCVTNPKRFRSKVPIVAYKEMRTMKGTNIIYSFVAGNKYELGKEYDAEDAVYKTMVKMSDVYDRGFHAYKNLEDAESYKDEHINSVIVQVELSDLTFKGQEVFFGSDIPVFVANKCKFIKIISSKS